MSLIPEVLLSNIARQKCVSKLKKLPSFAQLDSVPVVKAAVLIPLFIQNGEVHILYTLRSANLSSHKGQVSFPGGKIDGNESVVDAALRETHEEIGVPPGSIDVWCEMPVMQGRDKSVLITPVVGFIRDLNINNLKPNIYEVDDIFSVSMSAFCDTSTHAHFKYDGYMLPVFLGKHKIWGITALITHSFLLCFLPTNLYKIDFGRKKYAFEDLMASKL